MRARSQLRVADGSVVWALSSEKLYPEPWAPETGQRTNKSQTLISHCLVLPLQMKFQVTHWGALSRTYVPGVTVKPVEVTEMLGTAPRASGNGWEPLLSGRSRNE